MLLELRIENLLLIERAELRLTAGLNAITGETGAGKTVLAHSLDLLMGGRARPQIVRPGAREAYVEGVFEAPDGLFEDDELRELRERIPGGGSELVLGRRVGASGRTSAFVAGRSASAADLRALGGRLLAFYGQHEHRKLTLAAAQLEILDGFAGSEQVELRDAYREAHGEVRAIGAELEALRVRDGARERECDLLRYELAEIEAAAPDPGEEAGLEADRARLRHAETLNRVATGALAALAGEEDEGGASTMLSAAESSLGAVAGIDPELDRITARIGELALEAADAASELRRSLETFEADPARLGAVEERLDALERLKRKHGGSVEAVLAHAERCRDQLSGIERDDEMGAELERRLSAATERRAELAASLAKRRKRAATELEKRVADELGRLAMDGAKLEITLDPHPEGFGGSGTESVEFRVATNPGMPLAPLRDATSGGELSRLMLAMTGLGDAGGMATVVFDEIDAGVGGNTAHAVGERLRALATPDRRQVICITHLAQIAALADTHFRVSKRAAGGATAAEVELLHGEAVVREITRMLGGRDSDDAAIRHARELLAAA